MSTANVVPEASWAESTLNRGPLKALKLLAGQHRAVPPKDDAVRSQFVGIAAPDLSETIDADAVR